MSDAQEPQDSYDPSVPVLSEIFTPGDPGRARTGPAAASVGEPQPAAARASGAASPFAVAEGPDADALAERLRGRYQAWLAGEGRALVEARCRAALDAHSDRLVSQITQEVALALQAEIAGWVHDALRDETASRSGGVPFGGA